MSDSSHIRLVPMRVASVGDNFARYQMPEPVVRNKRQGQFSKTVVANTSQISKALHITPSWLIKFWSSDFNTLVQSGDGEEVIFKGIFTTEQVIDSLRRFIGNYLLCRRCDLPELDFQPGKKNLRSQCRACGQRAACDLRDDKVYKLVHQTLVLAKSQPQSQPQLQQQLEVAAANADEQRASELLPLSTGFSEPPKEVITDDSPTKTPEDEDEWCTDVSVDAVAARAEEAAGSSSLIKKLLQK